MTALSAGAAATVVAGYLLVARERRRIATYNAILEGKVLERTAQLHATQLEIVQRLGQAVDFRDEETGEHIKRMSELSHQLGLAAGMSADEAEMLRHAAALHDVGKIGVPDHVLSKPGKLDSAEWETMKSHTTIGAQLLAGSDSPLVQMAERVALTHHERWDGSGYPAGFAGEQIPLVGRICAICDVFDALTSERPYKRAWSVEETCQSSRARAESSSTPTSSSSSSLWMWSGGSKGGGAKPPRWRSRPEARRRGLRLPLQEARTLPMTGACLAHACSHASSPRWWHSQPSSGTAR